MTTNKTPHPAADLLRAIADGEQMQESVYTPWKNCGAHRAIELIAHGDDNRVRIAPRTITVNGIEVPEPMRVEPQLEAEYWVAEVTRERPAKYLWHGGDIGKRWLRRGLLHTTEAAAQAHVDAILALSRMDGGAA